MHAIVLTDQGLKQIEMPEPDLSPTDVMIRVGAAAINRMDLVLSGGGQYGSSGGLGTIPGLEWAGEIVKCGKPCSGQPPAWHEGNDDRKKRLRRVRAEIGSGLI